MRKKWINVLVGVAALVAGITVAPSAASAADPCAGGEVCFYEKENFGGTAFRATALKGCNARIANFADLTFTNPSVGLNDQVSSVKNWSGRGIFLSTDSFGQGKMVFIGPGVSVPNFTNASWSEFVIADIISDRGDLDNKFSSASSSAWWHRQPVPC